MHVDHKAGEKLYVNFASKTVEVLDPITATKTCAFQESPVLGSKISTNLRSIGGNSWENRDLPSE